MKNICSISEDKIEAASHSLSRAFVKDPLQTYVFPDASERAEKSPAHFKALLHYGYRFGEVHTTQDTAGAAVWLTPGNTDITPDKARAGGLDRIPDLLGDDASARFFAVMDYLDPFHKQDAPEPHWYTMVIGVDPAFSGKGYGKALMQQVMEKANTDKVSIYLETAQPSNIPFYTSLGFSVIRELIEPESNLRLWTFRRD